MSKKLLFSVSLLCVVTLAVGIYFLTRSPQESLVVEPVTTATSTPGVATTTSTVPSQNISVDTPDFAKPITFDSSISADTRTQLTSSLKMVQKKLTTNPLDMAAWINLGTLYKQGGDYQGAVAAWSFVAQALPTNVTAHFNLGDLYLNFLKDYPKAEKSFIIVTEQNPRIVDAYVNLFYLYHDFTKNDAKAASILAQGLKANPGNPILLDLEAQYKANK